MWVGLIMHHSRHGTVCVLAGVTTQCCVHSTLREAVDRGFRCLTLADATATGDPALQAATLQIIASEGHLFGWIATAGRVVEALAGETVTSATAP